MKKLRKKPAKKATRRAGAGGDAGVGKAILEESGRLANRRWPKRIRSSRFQFGPTPTPSGMKLHASFAWGIARRFVNSSTQGRPGSSCRPRFSNGGVGVLEQDKTLSLRGCTTRACTPSQAPKKRRLVIRMNPTLSCRIWKCCCAALREELHVFAKSVAPWWATSRFVMPVTKLTAANGDGRYAIPSICEPDVIEFVKCEADFVLHVEKDTVWSRFNEDRFWEKHNCILTEGSGQPPRGVRRLLQRLNAELGLPVICLLDCDPWGHYIYSVIKQGSMSLAFESERLAVPEAKFLGIRADDYERCGLSDDVKIALDDKDIKRAKEIMAYPWFADRRPWKKKLNACCATASRWKWNR